MIEGVEEQVKEGVKKKKIEKQETKRTGIVDKNEES